MQSCLTSYLRQMRGVCVPVLMAAALVIGGSIGAAEQEPFDVHDLVAMQRISDPQPSADGSRVAFTVTTMDLEANRGRHDIWLARTDGSKVWQLTTDPAADMSPRWLDNERLLFLSSRSGSVQVWQIATTGGEARQVTDLPLDVDSLTVGPGGGALYLGLKVFPDCEGSVKCTAERLEQEAQRKTSGRIYDRLMVRHWDAWKDGRRNHIHRLELDAEGVIQGEPVDLMAGVDGDCPTEPWGDDSDFTVSPDGRWLVYSAKVVEGSEEAWSTDWDLWAVPTDGSAPPRCLTEANQAWDAAPVFSPDGSSLAYLAMQRPGYEADRFRVMVMSWPDEAARAVIPEWDRSPRGLAWSHDGTTLYASADNVGNHSIFAINVAAGSVGALVTPHTNASPRPLPDGRVLFASDSLVSPVELYTVPSKGGEIVAITDLNRDRLEGLSFGKYEQFNFIGAHGDQVLGYLLYPVGFDKTMTYPLAFLIHGGPQGSFDDHWHYRWNPEIYAAHGYATVMIDFHGSTGYGQEFTDAINGDWGGAPYDDLMKGLDFVLDRYPFIDRERMAALGASFGGYMINWIQGKTDRFKALVCHDGNLDEMMAYYETEELWFPEWERGGAPFDHPEAFAKHSPITLVKHWSTPELVVHGARDYRVVETQGLGTFNALQRRGVPSRLLYYPDESHWVLKPLNSIQWHEVVLDWIDQWTAPAAEEK